MTYYIITFEDSIENSIPSLLKSMALDKPTVKRFHMKLANNSVKMIGKDDFLITIHKTHIIHILSLFFYGTGKNHYCIMCMMPQVEKFSSMSDR